VRNKERRAPLGHRTMASGTDGVGRAVRGGIRRTTMAVGQGRTVVGPTDVGPTCTGTASNGVGPCKRCVGGGASVESSDPIWGRASDPRDVRREGRRTRGLYSIPWKTGPTRSGEVEKWRFACVKSTSLLHRRWRSRSDRQSAVRRGTPTPRMSVSRGTCVGARSDARSVLRIGRRAARASDRVRRRLGRGPKSERVRNPPGEAGDRGLQKARRGARHKKKRVAPWSTPRGAAAWDAASAALGRTRRARARPTAARALPWGEAQSMPGASPRFFADGDLGRGDARRTSATGRERALERARCRGASCDGQARRRADMRAGEGRRCRRARERGPLRDLQRVLGVLIEKRFFSRCAVGRSHFFCSYFGKPLPRLPDSPSPCLTNLWNRLNICATDRLELCINTQGT